MNHLGIDWAAEPDIEQLRAAYWALEKNVAVSIASLVELAARGSVMSMIYLGDIFYQGRLVDKNFDQAEFWYLRAAAAGSPFANYTLGTFYLMAERYKDALRVFMIASNKGCPRATYLVGRLFWSGTGVERDPDFAKGYLERAAELGSIPAQRLLGRLLIENKTGATDSLRGLRLICTALIRQVFTRLKMF